MIQSRPIGSLTEIYVGGGNFITQAHPTNFHSFCRRKVLASSESVNDYKEVTQSERDQIEAQDAKWERPPQSFIDLWNGTRPNIDWINYNEDTGYFEINPTMFGKKVGFTDIGYKEAISIYERTGITKAVYNPYAGSNIRITMPLYNGGVYTNSNLVAIGDSMEVLCPVVNENTYIQHAFSALYMNKNLRTIFGQVLFQKNQNLSTNNIIGLENFHFELMGNNKINLKSAPHITYTSLLKTIQSSSYESNSTITVHADVFAKLTGDTTNAAAAALTSEELAEWQQILDIATKKQITFTT